jgi:hypothetical protein
MSDRNLIREIAGLLFEPGQIVELRVLNTTKATVAGYFDNLDQLAAAAARWDGKAPGVYWTLNPVNPDLLARGVNKLVEYAKHTTGDADIVKRRWLPIDFDPLRPAGISSTEDEHEAAIDMAIACRAWLMGEGCTSEPILADSGNGAHLLVPIDLPNDTDTRLLCERILKRVSELFDNDQVKVDRKTANAARIWKVYGTIAGKGDSTAHRPHRQAGILYHA